MKEDGWCTKCKKHVKDGKVGNWKHACLSYELKDSPPKKTTQATFDSFD